MVEQYPEVNKWQNIALIQFENICSNRVYEYIFNNLSETNDWLLCGYTPYETNSNFHLIEEDNKLTAINVSQTIVLLKSDRHASHLPNILKLKILNCIPQIHNIFDKNNKELEQQNEGEAYVMLKINQNYQLVKIKLFFNSFNYLNNT